MNKKLRVKNTVQARISILCLIFAALGLGVVVSLAGVAPIWSFLIIALYLVGGLPAILFTVFAQRRDDATHHSRD